MQPIEILPMFRGNIFPQFSGLKSKLRKKSALSKQQTDGSDIFFRSVGRLSPIFVSLHKHRCEILQIFKEVYILEFF
jgi:hypothetical protein